MVILFAAMFVGRTTLLVPSARAGITHMPIIAHNGFGDTRNSYAWSMAWFRGALYVGTARSAVCVERATLAYYFPWGDYYTTRPAPGVRCPKTIADDDLRAQIWRYTPQNRRWTLVYRSPTVPNPQAPGHRVARDIGYRGMVVFKQPGGRRALYVAGVTADEFIPGLARRYPPRILMTTDGTHFRTVEGGPAVIHAAQGLRRPIGYRAMTAVGGALYVTASSGLTGDGVVLRVQNPAGSSPRFTQVSPSHLDVFELAAFDGHLYAGTGDARYGYGVWRADGRRHLRWRPVVTGGAGRGAVVTSVVSMEPYRGQLYVGASGWGTSIYPPSELIRIAPDGRWDVVVGAPRSVAGVLKVPVSGLGDGFGNPFNLHFWRMQVYRGALLLGTNDWSWSLQDNPQFTGLLKSEFGFDLYGTCNGTDWWTATRDGFGNPDDFGARTMAVSPNHLFLGTTNLVHGTTIRESRAQPCAAAGVPAAARVHSRGHLWRHLRMPARLPLSSELPWGIPTRRNDPRHLRTSALTTGRHR